MNRFFYRKPKFKAKSKTKKRPSKKLDWIATGLLFAGAFSFYCVLFPQNAGLWGRETAKAMGWFAGVGRFFLPLVAMAFGLRGLFRAKEPINGFKTVLVLALIWSAHVALSLFGLAIWETNIGGVLGLLGQAFLTRLFGVVGAWFVTLGAICSLSILLSGLSPGDLAHSARESLARDWAEWKKARASEKPKKRKTPVVPAAEALTANPFPQAKKEEIENKTEPSEPPRPPKIMERENPLPKQDKPKVPPKKEEATGDVDNGETSEEPNKPITPYHSPSLEVFESFGGGNPVPKEELTARANLLETTLGNFNIAARVVEIHPGPVITRYDLEPAPGVKVASIASRSDDLALALRSTGIRVLAPIPGKGAVGVEIPNSNPELVGLQEMLGKPDFLEHKSPLAFSLGKTVSGEPYFVDLAAMPHMLVAGATGSGKSVVVHAMISSILYRMPPDRVKFVLIDPKRLELPSYSMIPHLYDPCHDPINAEVITNPKQSSKALARMVKVMEYRYDLFSKANVRNIDSYNNKMKKQGKPEAPFIVVIIDELADLMLTSPKEVEDSIQRLAQMARAVGIHLVLATQRPSVDVITGVIKANLPARIALRVASGTDSRVIVDTVGAEGLLGKGDMLFLPPAAMEPIRVQGAFVSEEEVENLVTHVKQFGLPSYDDLFSSGSALEFAVEDKKEMKDLIEGCKLILQRHRVSQDLLKAHLGSSARATNILSLLEVKEFIRKPEGSNRWEINFDLIEQFLDKVNRVPEMES